jgi:ABC-type nitrate/sulfonate/bicarbonate transport system ATPase subunit
VLLVTHDVEEALYLSDRVLVLSPRPGRVAAEIEVPAPRAGDRAVAVTAPEFGALKQRALRTLSGEGP